MARKKACDEPSFEASLAELERTVEALESGTLSLDEALARYEAGVRLLARSRSLLDAAERKVALLSGVDASGQPITEPFDASATFNQEAPTDSRPPSMHDDDLPF